MNWRERDRRVSFAVDIHGVTYREPKKRDLLAIVGSLEDADQVDQTEVWVSFPGDITLSYSITGVMIWETGEEFEKILHDVTEEEAIAIWLDALANNWDCVAARDWDKFESD